MDIVLDHVTKVFPTYEKSPGLLGGIFRRKKREKLAINDLNLTIPSGSLIAVLGPNGSGKTTLMKMLSGILVPTAGTIKIGHFTPAKREKKFLQKISLVMGQKSQLWWDLPPMDSFLFLSSIYEVPKKKFQKQLQELADLLNINGLLYTPTRKLSLGERMRCELVAALLHEPGILFLDEPTIGLDIVSQQKIRQFIQEYHQQKKATILLTSHNMEDIESICKKIIIVNQGTIVFEGTVENFKKTHPVDAIIHFTLQHPQSLPSAVKKYTHKNHSDLVVTITVPYNDLGFVTSELLSKLKLHSFTIKEPSFDAVISKFFIKTTHS